MDVRTRHTCASSMPPHVHLEHRQLSTDARTESTHLRGSTRMMFLTMRTPTTFCRFFTYTGIRLCPVLSWQMFRVRFRVCSSPHSSCAFAMPVYGGGQEGRAGGGRKGRETRGNDGLHAVLVERLVAGEHEDVFQTVHCVLDLRVPGTESE